MKTRDLYALSFAALVLSLPAVARAEDEIDASTLRAEKLASEAEAKVAGGAYDQAIELYVAAYKETPAAVLLFDMAWIYDHHLGQKTEAVELYRRAIAAGDLEPRLVKQAEARLAVLDPPRTAPADLAIAPAPKRDEPDRAWPPLKIAGVATAGVGIAGIGTSLVLGALAKSKDDEANAFCSGDRCTDARALSLTDDATGLATGANIAFVTGAVLVVSGVVMWLVAK